MKAEHEKELFELAPILYSGHKESMRHCLMCFGFECEDGWFYPLRSLSAQVEAKNILMRKYGVYIKATQVKEKFGTLRFYYEVRVVLPWWKRLAQWVLDTLRIERYIDGSQAQHTLVTAADTWMEEMVNKCEKECYGVCEICGNQIDDESESVWCKRVITDSYVRVLCQSCADKNNYTYRTPKTKKARGLKKVPNVEIPSKKIRAKANIKKDVKPIPVNCNETKIE